MVAEHRAKYDSQWAAIASIAAEIGCTDETLREWVRQYEARQPPAWGLTTAGQQRIKALEREVCERRQASEILRKASAYFD